MKKIIKNNNLKTTYIVKDVYCEKWEKLSEEEKKKKFNEQYLKYIIKMENKKINKL